jgi:hypothetical protein
VQQVTKHACSAHPHSLLILALPNTACSQAGTLYASALSQLGLVYGTTERGRDFLTIYLEPAFISSGWYNATLLNLVEDPAAPGAVASEAALNQGLNLAASGNSAFLDQLAFNLTQVITQWNSSEALGDQLYCGYRQARRRRVVLCPALHCA